MLYLSAVVSSIKNETHPQSKPVDIVSLLQNGSGARLSTSGSLLHSLLLVAGNNSTAPWTFKSSGYYVRETSQPEPVDIGLSPSSSGVTEWVAQPHVIDPAETRDRMRKPQGKLG